MITRLLILATFLMFSFGRSEASNGAYQLSKACVDTGCFLGDSGGFPITIIAPGNYVLTSDIVVPAATTDAIVVSSDNVSIDLAGFSIRGPNICNGQTAGCSIPTLAGTGIGGISQTNVSVKNGIVRGFGYSGVNLGQNSYIERVRADNNGRVGIWVRLGSTVENSFSNFNGYLGFEAAQSRLIDCSAADNGQIGMNLGGGSTVIGAIVVRTQGIAGISGGTGTLIVSSSISNNVTGVSASAGGLTLIDSVVIKNQGLGVNSGNDSTYEVVAPIMLRGNSIFQNNGGDGNAQIGGDGSYVQLGLNLCGSTTACP